MPTACLARPDENQHPEAALHRGPRHGGISGETGQPVHVPRGFNLRNWEDWQNEFTVDEQQAVVMKDTDFIYAYVLQAARRSCCWSPKTVLAWPTRPL